MSRKSYLFRTSGLRPLSAESNPAQAKDSGSPQSSEGILNSPTSKPFSDMTAGQRREMNQRRELMNETLNEHEEETKFTPY